MYRFVLVPDCTIHFVNVLNAERAKRARKKNVVPFKLFLWIGMNILCAALFLIAKCTIIMVCHIRHQDDVHPHKKSLNHP